MLVRLSEIPTHGLKITDTLDLERLNARLHEGSRSEGIVFTSAPKVNLTLHPAGQGAESKGTLECDYVQDCSLCNDGVPRTISTKAEILFRPRPPDVDPDDPDYFDDVGVSFFSGDQVDLEPILQECLILALSIFWHPEQDKKGNCTHCGKECSLKELRDDKDLDLSVPQSTSLGELLKKAQVKK